jgi:hypothetical protein
VVAPGTAVGVEVRVGVCVFVGVKVRVAVALGVGVCVAVGCVVAVGPPGVLVTVGVTGVLVDVGVLVTVGENVAVGVADGTGVPVGPLSIWNVSKFVSQPFALPIVTVEQVAVQFVTSVARERAGTVSEMVGWPAHAAVTTLADVWSL